MGLFARAEKIFKIVLENNRNKKNLNSYMSKHYLGLFTKKIHLKFHYHFIENNLLFLGKTKSSLQTYLELASRFIYVCQYKKAIEILTLLLKHNIKNAMVYYYLGYCNIKLNQIEKSRYYYKLAVKETQDYVFPHRTEEIEILNTAIKNNPMDSHARYFLGNLLYYKGRVDEAIQEWEKSLELGNNYSILCRNLGFAYWKSKKDFKSAVYYYKKSIEIDSFNIKAYFELNEIYRLTNNNKDREKLFKDIPEKLKKNEQIIKKWSEFYIDTKQFNKAINLLNTTKFYFPKEGEQTVRNLLEKSYTGKFTSENLSGFTFLK